MWLSQAPYRELLEAMWDCEDADLEATLLRPWADRHGEQVRRLLDWAQARGGRWPQHDPEFCAQLYALSRVEQVLTFRRKSNWLETLGLVPFQPEEFHPFYCEIVLVEESHTPTAIVAVEWPGWRAGNLLLARAGCHVKSNSMRRHTAESSVMYWAYRRARPHEDESFGWGSSSQWATSMRRDYELGDSLYYNVDAPNHPTDEHRIELVRHRCYLIEELPWDYPYRDGYRESRR